jgi:hypothetical protein
MEDNLTFLVIKDDLNFLKMEDYPIVKYRRQPQLFPLFKRKRTSPSWDELISPRLRQLA